MTFNEFEEKNELKINGIAVYCPQCQKRWTIHMDYMSVDDITPDRFVCGNCKKEPTHTNNPRTPEEIFSLYGLIPIYILVMCKRHNLTWKINLQMGQSLEKLYFGAKVCRMCADEFFASRNRELV